MSIRKVNEKEITKDGRSWIFELRYKDNIGNIQYYKSKKFMTKKEASKEEREFKNRLDINNENRNMTFKDLCDKHFEYQKDKVKGTTLRNYIKRREYLRMFDDIKLVDLNINHFEEWKKSINERGLATRTKNDLYKYLKSILNYGSKWYNYNFSSMYNKMTNFTNPNEIQKEMDFWTKDEFDRFISVETDIKYKTLFEILYYGGLRSGELRGLKWNNIDFENKEVSIKNNIVNYNDGKSLWHETTPKTKGSIRTILLPDFLIENLRTLKEISKSCYGFTDDWYVFGSFEPIKRDLFRVRKNKDCELSGVKQIRIHDFRHSCASLLINNGANITLVAKYLGHTKIDETLNTYSHMFKNTLGSIVNIINEMNKD